MDPWKGSAPPESPNSGEAESTFQATADDFNDSARELELHLQDEEWATALLSADEREVYRQLPVGESRLVRWAACQFAYAIALHDICETPAARGLVRSIIKTLLSRARR